MTTIKNKVQNNIFILKEKIKEVDGVATLKFLPTKGKFFHFQAGQFVLVRFLDGRFGQTGKAYSISSSSRDKFLSITAKKAGNFSSALHKLKRGESLKISGPYGDFYPDKSMKKLVFLAGGIGIVPLFSIIRDNFLKKSPKKITLFYSSQTKKGVVFLKELNKIADERRNFKLIYFITREKPQRKKIGEYRRINVRIMKKYLEDSRGNFYFVCGPKEFVSDLRKKLKNGGVSEKFIKSESFY